MLDQVMTAGMPEHDGDPAGLLDAALHYYGSSGIENVVAAPGSQALIQLLPQVLDVDRATILGPTYNEHERVWRHSRVQVATVNDLSSFLPGGALVVVNPNNPDGRILDHDQLEALAKQQMAAGGWLVIDEAFADVAPECSAVPLVSGYPVIILKSFGKFFGLAGLCLGFAIAPATLCDRIARLLGPWAVAGPALAIGADAMNDRAWQAKTRARLEGDAHRMDEILSGRGTTIIGGTSLYRLTRFDRTGELYEHLLRTGIAVRQFRDHPHWLRFGLPDEAGFIRLERTFNGFASGV